MWTSILNLSICIHLRVKVIGDGFEHLPYVSLFLHRPSPGDSNYYYLPPRSPWLAVRMPRKGFFSFALGACPASGCAIFQSSQAFYQLRRWSTAKPCFVINND